jgi:hypothetical protein
MGLGILLNQGATLMTAETLTTNYIEVAHLDSFWEAVDAFLTLKAEEGEEIAEDLITDYIVGSAEGEYGKPWDFMERTTRRQEAAYRALERFLNDPDCPQDYPADMAVWETMKGSQVGE